MEFLGIGPFEFILIILVALIVLGPNDMIKTGRSLGAGLRKLITSSTFRTVQKASTEIRNLPNTLMREAGVDEIKEMLPTAEQIQKESGLKDLEKDLGKVKQDVATTQSNVSMWLTPKPAPETQPTPASSEGAPQNGGDNSGAPATAATSDQPTLSTKPE